MAGAGRRCPAGIFRRTRAGHHGWPAGRAAPAHASPGVFADARTQRHGRSGHRPGGRLRPPGPSARRAGPEPGAGRCAGSGGSPAHPGTASRTGRSSDPGALPPPPGRAGLGHEPGHRRPAPPLRRLERPDSLGAQPGHALRRWPAFPETPPDTRGRRPLTAGPSSEVLPMKFSLSLAALLLCGSLPALAQPPADQILSTQPSSSQAAPAETPARDGTADRVLSTAPAQADSAQAVSRVFEQRFPGIHVDAVRVTPTAGIFEIQVGRDLRYTDAQVDYVLQGSMIDARARRDLTAER